MYRAASKSFSTTSQNGRVGILVKDLDYGHVWTGNAKIPSLQTNRLTGTLKTATLSSLVSSLNHNSCFFVCVSSDVFMAVYQCWLVVKKKISMFHGFLA